MDGSYSFISLYEIQILKSMNWYIIIPSGLAIIGLIVFMVRHNYKEKKIFENELNTNYPKSKHEDDNGEVEEES